MQNQPIAAPIFGRDLTYNCARAREVSGKALILVCVAYCEIAADEMAVIVRFECGGAHTFNENKLSYGYRRRTSNAM